MNVRKPEKIEWQGTIVSVQPRTTVWRYRLDNRTHYHRGYNIFLDGISNGNEGRFSVAISEKQQQKLVFRIGDEAKGTAWTKMYDVSDYADFYRAGSLKITQKAERSNASYPPFTIEPPSMEVYEIRGARMLSSACYKGKCFQCAFATMSAVEIEYNWGVSRKYRFEAFCYGPFSCKFYKMGKSRAVPYKDYGSDYDTGWLDDLCTECRGDDPWETQW
ncbi:MAG: hypothetical protein ACOX2M_08565 [Fastidiosipilaceae bacterium]|jgi:hypothetical protein